MIFKVQDFKEKGRGVIATKYFLKGDFVVEYAGDLMDASVAKEKEEQYAKDSKIGCYMYYFRHRDKHYWYLLLLKKNFYDSNEIFFKRTLSIYLINYSIDGTAESGKLGRLVNHSRKGNLISRIVEVGSNPHLVLLAKVDIEPTTEILYDYGDRDKETLRNHPWLAL